jgi:hypothetical protein
MFSVVIPTIWKSKKTLDLLKSFSENKKVSEIILIDNNPNFSMLKNNLCKKIKTFVFEKNIYVNPSWNFGVSKAKEDKIIISNDDIILDTNLITDIDVQEDTLIGINNSCYHLNKNQNIYISTTNQINLGYGCLIMFQKKYYRPIPEIFKIYYGDNFLFESFKNKKCIHGLKIETIMSESCNVPELKSIIYKDIYQNNITPYKTFIKG